MLTEQLREAMEAAADRQPFVPDTSRALVRAARVRRRRRLAGVLAVIALAGLGAGTAAALPARPDVALPASGGRDATQRGEIEFSVREVAADTPCAFEIVLAGDANAAGIGMPCTPLPLRTPEAGSKPWTSRPDADPALPAPPSRQDLVVLDGHRRLVTSGTAPAGSVTVTAEDASGHPLTATLRTVPFTDEVIFAMQSDGRRVTDLRYVLADGRSSLENTVSTP